MKDHHFHTGKKGKNIYPPELDNIRASFVARFAISQLLTE